VHGWQAAREVEPVKARVSLPAGHGRQAGKAGPSEYRFAAHTPHELLDVRNCPGVHVMQVGEPVAAKRPGAQAVQGVPPPGETAKGPHEGAVERPDPGA
jgi:hypothetical protein